MSSACLKALEKLSIYAQDISDAKGWLLQLLYHHCMDIRRARARQCPSEALGEDEATLVPDTGRQHEATPEQLLFQLKTQRTIDRALAHLPTRRCAPAILRFCQELLHHDIAERLCLTPTSVGKPMQQARALLQEESWAAEV